MLTVLALLLVVCAVCITLGIFGPKAWALAALGGSVLIYVLAWYVWILLWWFQVVPIDKLIARLGLYRLEGIWGQLIVFVPPLLPVVIFNYLLIVVRRRRADKLSSASK